MLRRFLRSRGAWLDARQVKMAYNLLLLLQGAVETRSITQITLTQEEKNFIEEFSKKAGEVK